MSTVGMMPCSSVTTVARYSEYLSVYSRYDALLNCQYSSSLYSEYLSIANATKAIAAHAIVTKKETHLLNFFHIM